MCPKCGKEKNPDCFWCRVHHGIDFRGRSVKANIYLDDVRGCPYNEEGRPSLEKDGYWHEYEYGPGIDYPGQGHDWHVARTYQSCINLLEKFRGGIGILSLDHDLGDIHTGYDVLTWLEERIHQDPSYPLPEEIRFHTANPEGRRRMTQVLQKLYRGEA